MDIEIGKYYDNKTWKYLLPCLRGHGDTFVSKYNPVFKLAVGIHDTLVDGSPMFKDLRVIFLMCDKKHQERKFEEFLNWISYQDYYKTDYCPSADLASRKHVIVLTIPEEYIDAYDYFLQGKYSLMYTQKQIDFLFSNPTRKNEKDILMRNSNVFIPFMEKVREEFGINPNPKDFISSEYELPLKRNEEIFNCVDNQRVYFNEELDKVWQE